MTTKETLLESSKHHQRMIKHELMTISNKTTDIARQLLLVGSIAGGAYLLYKALSTEKETNSSSKKKDNKKRHYQPLSRIGRVSKTLSHQLLLFILNQGKSKIKEYLNELEKDAVNS